MSERKVLNKYYPPDFDPSKIPKLKLPKDRQYVVRLMAPFNMRCTTCGEYIYKGKKFNARKETVQGETYLGLLIFRFYIRCPRCISEITFKTDPENTDYVCEKGATRNFQAQLMMERQEEAQKKEREEDELNNPMKALENRTKESKQEMDILEKLEELRDLNTRQAEVNYEKMLDIYQQYEKEIKEKEEKEDEELVKSIFGSNKIQRRLSDSGSDSNDDSQEKLLKSSKQTEIGKKRATDVLTQESKSEPPNKKANLWDRGIGKLGSKVLLDSLVKVKNHNKPRNSDRITEKISESASRTASDNLQSSTTSNVEQEPSTNEDGNGSLGLLGSYGSSSDSE